MHTQHRLLVAKLLVLLLAGFATACSTKAPASSGGDTAPTARPSYQPLSRVEAQALETGRSPYHAATPRTTHPGAAPPRDTPAQGQSRSGVSRAHSQSHSASADGTGPTVVIDDEPLAEGVQISRVCESTESVRSTVDGAVAYSATIQTRARFDISTQNQQRQPVRTTVTVDAHYLNNSASSISGHSYTSWRSDGAHRWEYQYADDPNTPVPASDKEELRGISVDLDDIARVERALSRRQLTVGRRIPITCRELLGEADELLGGRFASFEVSSFSLVPQGTRATESGRHVLLTMKLGLVKSEAPPLEAILEGDIVLDTRTGLLVSFDLGGTVGGSSAGGSISVTGYVTISWSTRTAPTVAVSPVQGIPEEDVSPGIMVGEGRSAFNSDTQLVHVTSTGSSFTIRRSGRDSLFENRVRTRYTVRLSSSYTPVQTEVKVNESFSRRRDRITHSPIVNRTFTGRRNSHGIWVYEDATDRTKSLEEDVVLAFQQLDQLTQWGAVLMGRRLVIGSRIPVTADEFFGEGAFGALEPKRFVLTATEVQGTTALDRRVLLTASLQLLEQEDDGFVAEATLTGRFVIHVRTGLILSRELTGPVRMYNTEDPSFSGSGQMEITVETSVADVSQD